MQQKNNLSGIALASVLEKDRYFALPESVSLWLNTFKLKASDRLLIERLISLAIQSPNRGNDSLGKRVSLSLLEEKTGIQQRTIINSLESLTGKHLIGRGDTNQKGTYYSINLSSDIMQLINERFVNLKAESKKQDKMETGEHDQACKGDLENSVNLGNVRKELLELEKQLANLTNQITENQKMINDAFKESMPPGFRPIDILKAKGNLNFNANNNVKVSELQRKQDLLEKQFNMIKVAIEELKKQGEHSQKFAQQTIEEPTGAVNKKKRFIGKNQIKAIQTRISKLKVSDPKGLLNEVVWAIRNGWYTAKTDWDNFHCTNHAIKMIANNTWRTPAGFNPLQVIGLVAFANK